MGGQRDRQIKRRDEAMKRLSDAHRAQMKADALVLFEAQQIVQRLYLPWWDDQGLIEALRAVEQHLVRAAESGDGSGPPPDFAQHLWSGVSDGEPDDRRGTLSR